MNKPADDPPKNIVSYGALSSVSATDLQAKVSSRLSEMSVESTTSDILDMKLAAMESELEYMRCVRDGLNEARRQKRSPMTPFQQETEPFLKSFRSSSSTIHVLKA
ncbi:uncharacterized protein N7518_001300 [Penicillium psychrosexuale]|uniref:uncharacterized protein n=1 Tax=Penicillium psychrosexuale TaxID=1002107 RepID=UPI002544FB2E|nr:uncharacterized protein N7518_001300 [Penicillium psychrosexuale]KAJ5799232.1 hypothetical protein N7518_001300 [Penicillium psychrosexuale]